jgi:hypothetical protein
MLRFERHAAAPYSSGRKFISLLLPLGHFDLFENSQILPRLCH